MELGVHLPLIQFGDDALSLRRLEATVAAARRCGFAAVSANDHLVFQTPWLDGPTALAAVIDRTDEMQLATTVALRCAEAGCERVYLWPLGDEPRQLELVAEAFR